LRLCPKRQFRSSKFEFKSKPPIWSKPDFPFPFYFSAQAHQSVSGGGTTAHLAPLPPMRFKRDGPDAVAQAHNDVSPAVGHRPPTRRTLARLMAPSLPPLARSAVSALRSSGPRPRTPLPPLRRPSHHGAKEEHAYTAPYIAGLLSPLRPFACFPRHVPAPRLPTATWLSKWRARVHTLHAPHHAQAHTSRASRHAQPRSAHLAPHAITTPKGEEQSSATIFLPSRPVRLAPTDTPLHPPSPASCQSTKISHRSITGHHDHSLAQAQIRLTPCSIHPPNYTNVTISTSRINRATSWLAARPTLLHRHTPPYGCTTTVTVRTWTAWPRLPPSSPSCVSTSPRVRAPPPPLHQARGSPEHPPSHAAVSPTPPDRRPSPALPQGQGPMGVVHLRGNGRGSPHPGLSTTSRAAACAQHRAAG